MLVDYKLMPGCEKTAFDCFLVLLQKCPSIKTIVDLRQDFYKNRDDISINTSINMVTLTLTAILLIHGHWLIAFYPIPIFFVVINAYILSSGTSNQNISQKKTEENDG